MVVSAGAKKVNFVGLGSGPEVQSVDSATDGHDSDVPVALSNPIRNMIQRGDQSPSVHVLETSQRVHRLSVLVLARQWHRDQPSLGGPEMTLQDCPAIDGCGTFRGLRMTVTHVY
ncbi:hypothetical protein ISF_07485 [Cordyceps fumosorosea ARSEF 2679]|uniref:Uncharacterized protein n=1 Tax=Cordyceps fumosorosea (strain ARSEF 2679) TaxID=1081104 RepID=A0A167P971_CORFA|nr:hypothetical protein ISF_07485 [Cordyceps fumosorosea ARSEF 2679]OAA56417.1 hypothetical protein ISF_07485 [Cordyceps fumosorosea ARSEF 2679]